MFVVFVPVSSAWVDYLIFLFMYPEFETLPSPDINKLSHIQPAKQQRLQLHRPIPHNSPHVVHKKLGFIHHCSQANFKW